MKKRMLPLIVLLIILSTLLLSCAKNSTIICGNCSKSNTINSKYCSHCGTAFFQNNTLETTEKTAETLSETENTQATTDTTIEAYKDILQGHWVLKVEGGFFVLSFDFNKNEIQEGYYRSEGRTYQVKDIMLALNSALVIKAFSPGVDDEFDPIPPKNGYFVVTFKNQEKDIISVQWSLNEPSDYKFAGKTQESLADMCGDHTETTDTDYINNNNTINKETETDTNHNNNDKIINKEITADTWYYVTTNNVVQFQNAAVHNAVSMSQGTVFMVTYYPICKSCHTQGGTMRMKGVAPDIPLTDTHYCQSCGTTTYVRFKIVY